MPWYFTESTQRTLRYCAPKNVSQRGMNHLGSFQVRLGIPNLTKQQKIPWEEKWAEDPFLPTFITLKVSSRLFRGFWLGSNRTNEPKIHEKSSFHQLPIIPSSRDFRICFWTQWLLQVFRWSGCFFLQQIILPETKRFPLIIGHSKRKLVFQPSIFRCKLAVSFRGKNCIISTWGSTIKHLSCAWNVWNHHLWSTFLLWDWS